MIVRARTPVRHIAGALASPPAQCTGEDARTPHSRCAGVPACAMYGRGRPYAAQPVAGVSPAQCTGKDARMPERAGALASPPAQCTGEDARTPHARTTIVVTCHREPHF